MIEVIYSTMDGNVYFLDHGRRRTPRETCSMYWACPLRAAGALDPRKDDPICLYWGRATAAQTRANTPVRWPTASLTVTLLFEFGGEDPFCLNGYSTVMTALHLVHKETDTLIEPGENGIFYTMKLNTVSAWRDGKLVCHPSDARQGALSVQPAAAKSVYWLGMEDSAVMLEQRYDHRRQRRQPLLH